MKSIPERQQAERKAVCQQCPQNINNRCRQCGCKIPDVITKLNKYQRAGSFEYLVKPACPLKKWPEYAQR